MAFAEGPKREPRNRKTTRPPQDRKVLLRETASSFCQALLQDPPLPPSDLIRRFFVPDLTADSSKSTLVSASDFARITEHGPEWARTRLPFLGRTFIGHEDCISYFTLLSETLKMHMGPDTFPGVESGGYVVDPKATVEDDDLEGVEAEGIVSVVGKARFESVKTGKAWEEKFIYRFSGFDREGKIGHWEIWADPLSAWVACE
ncbi:uncharacterized protein PAC_15785 [Phialocephala subalpina]|uniref:SnoaL-like domain-containing protein n=1 Tax=Phialocephala subalpina TaxID=576137 RepID=A0A1L7XLF4_9HELO|nr:uncharacterized protein PAC_15785 [Phialocephala subalpina]